MSVVVPNWYPDDLCSACTDCGSEFWIFSRKHHCRDCGKIFCGTCTSKQLELPNIRGFSFPVRVCENCFQANSPPSSFPERKHLLPGLLRLVVVFQENVLKLNRQKNETPEQDEERLEQFKQEINAFIHELSDLLDLHLENSQERSTKDAERERERELNHDTREREETWKRKVESFERNDVHLRKEIEKLLTDNEKQRENFQTKIQTLETEIQNYQQQILSLQQQISQQSNNNQHRETHDESNQNHNNKEKSEKNASHEPEFGNHKSRIKSKKSRNNMIDSSYLEHLKNLDTDDNTNDQNQGRSKNNDGTDSPSGKIPQSNQNDTNFDALLQSLNAPQNIDSNLNNREESSDYDSLLKSLSSGDVLNSEEPQLSLDQGKDDLLKLLENNNQNPSEIQNQDNNADLSTLLQSLDSSNEEFNNSSGNNVGNHNVQSLLDSLNFPSSDNAINQFPDATDDLLKLLGTNGTSGNTSSDQENENNKGVAPKIGMVRGSKVRQSHLRMGLDGLWGDQDGNENNSNHDGDHTEEERETFGVLYKGLEKYKERERERDRELIFGFGVRTEVNKAGLKRAKKSVVKMGKTIFQNEDEHFCEFPFFGRKDLAFFSIYDGHVDRNAAVSAAQTLPSEFYKLITEPEGNITRTNFSSEWTSSYVAADSKLTEFEYEGTTVTTALIWLQSDPVTSQTNLYLQVANVGDSNAYLFRGESVIELTQEHRVTNPNEQARMRLVGQEVSPHQTRINGLSVSRTLGDHFVKQNSAGLTAEPHVSEPVLLTPEDSFLVIASDGLWDVTSAQEAYETIKRMKEPQEMSKRLIMDALKKPGCVDNLTVIVVCL